MRSGCERGWNRNYACYVASDTMVNPDLANDPEVSAMQTAAYIKDRYYGGGFKALIARADNNTPDIRVPKTCDYKQFKTSGEYAARRLVSA